MAWPRVRERALRLSFGGAAGTLASLGDQGLAVSRELAAELDLAEADIPWHVARDGLNEAVCWLGILCGTLAKIATDVMLMMQTELAEVSEPHVRGRGGSSTMPQKRNPIACEYVLSQARGVHALVPQMLGAMAQDFERGTGPWQTELLALPQAFLLGHGALSQARFIAEGLVVDAARMRRNVDATGGLIVSEAVMMGLAPVFGRGEAHHIVNDACDLAIAEGIGLTEALMRDARVSARLDERRHREDDRPGRLSRQRGRLRRSRAGAGADDDAGLSTAPAAARRRRPASAGMGPGGRRVLSPPPRPVPASAWPLRRNDAI